MTSPTTGELVTVEGGVEKVQGRLVWEQDPDPDPVTAHQSKGNTHDLICISQGPVRKQNPLQNLQQRELNKRNGLQSSDKTWSSSSKRSL